MAKFEKYDQVELNKDLDIYELLEGEQGVVMSELLEDELYAIAFGFTDEAEDLLHDCNGLLPNGNGLFIAEKDLRKTW